MGVSQTSNLHNVITLSVHDEDQQTIVWQEGGLARALERGEKTMLTEYFTLNRNSEAFRHRMYSDIVETHSWNDSEKCWKPRKLGQGKEKQERYIARLVLIPLSAQHESEYYLRSLLLNVPGPQSFEHIRTVNEIVYSSTKEACIALGLLTDDREAERCMDEICRLFNGKSIRNTFALLLVFMRPHDALALWNKYSDNMIDDFRYRHRLSNRSSSVEIYTQMALNQIESFLLQHNVTLAHVGLPSLTTTEDDFRLHTLVGDMEDEIALVDKAELADMIDKMKGNPEQWLAFETIISAV